MMLPSTAVQNLLQKETYLRESRELLKKSFPLISCDAINFIFDRKSDFNFGDAFRRLSFIKANPDTIIEDKPGIRVFIKYPRRKAKQELIVTDTDLLVEINSIPELNQKASANPPIETIDLSNTEDSEDEEKDARFECHVCYADYAKSEIEDCGAGEGHSVCKHCICRFVSEQLHGNGSLKFKCIGDVNCTREYLPALLEKVLPEELNRQVIDRTFHEVAKLPGMWQCPAGCGHVGFAGGMFPWVECPACICRYCTKCNEKYHHEKTCDEARQERETTKNPLHRAHEAMTKATKRFCPYLTCKQEFIKGDGCNKIKCISCNGLSCYLCGSMIKGYEHFKERGGTCDLWTPTGEIERMDRKKRFEAGRKVLTDAGFTDENEVLRLLGFSIKKKNAMDNNQDQVAPRHHFFVNNQEQQGIVFGNNRDPQIAEGFANQREGRNAGQVNQNIGQEVMNGNANPINANPAAPRVNFRMNDREQDAFNFGNYVDRHNPPADAPAANRQVDQFAAGMNRNVGLATVNPDADAVNANNAVQRLNFRMNDREQHGFNFGNYRARQDPLVAATAAAAAAAAAANNHAGYATGVNQNVGRTAANDHVHRRMSEQFNNIRITDPIRPNRFSLNGAQRAIGHQPNQIQNHRAPAIPGFAARPNVRNPYRADNDDNDSVVTNAAVVWKPHARRDHH